MTGLRLILVVLLLAGITQLHGSHHYNYCFNNVVLIQTGTVVVYNSIEYDEWRQCRYLR